jgi:hypothetical protein
MITLVNFGHPLSSSNLKKVMTMCNLEVKEYLISSQHDRTRSLAEIARELTDLVGFSANEWQTEFIILNPPGLSPLAIAIVTEIHGRSGKFPGLINICPFSEKPTRYEVTEVINLQVLRDMARRTC